MIDTLSMWRRSADSRKSAPTFFRLVGPSCQNFFLTFASLLPHPPCRHRNDAGVARLVRHEDLRILEQVHA